MASSPRSHVLLLALLAAAVAFLPACDSDDTGGSEVQRPDTVVGQAATPGEWSWVSIDGAQCRDGSGTGFGVRTRPGSDQLVIYLEGGGACFSEGTCASNPSRYGESDFEAAFGAGNRGERGLFASDREENPLRDWNMVYVPYCTGDVHGGSNPDGEILLGDVGPQQFVGHLNMERYLDALKAFYRDDLASVMLTGASAGGFGTLTNFDDTATRFAGADLYLLDDSGPIFFDDAVYPPALQQLQKQIWNLDASLPEGTSLTDPDGLENAYAYYAETYPGATFGLASHLQDAVIRQFFGVLSPISGPQYAAALRDLDEQAPAAWRTYYAPSDDHTFLGGERFYETTVDGVPLTDWVADLIAGDAPDVAPPAGATAAPAAPVAPKTSWAPAALRDRLEP